MTPKKNIRERAAAMGVALGPTIKDAGLIDWWRAASGIDRTHPNWQTIEARANWGGHNPAALFDAPGASRPAQRAAPPIRPAPVMRAQPPVPIVPPAQPAPAAIPEPIPTKPTWWQRVRGWLQ